MVLGICPWVMAMWTKTLRENFTTSNRHVEDIDYCFALNTEGVFPLQNSPLALAGWRAVFLSLNK